MVDYTNEAYHMIRVGDSMAPLPGIRVPVVFTVTADDLSLLRRQPAEELEHLLLPLREVDPHHVRGLRKFEERPGADAARTEWDSIPPPDPRWSV